MWSKPWYPEDVPRRPVQVSWIVSLGPDDSCHETELPTDPHALRQLVAPNLGARSRVDMDGYISVIFRDEELLGKRFWVYDGHYLSKAIGTQTYSRSGDSTTVNLQGNHKVSFTRESAHHKTRTVHMPKTFLEEWDLMLLRIKRISSTIMEQALPRGFVSEHVRPGLAEYSMTADLSELLRNPVPQLD